MIGYCVEPIAYIRGKNCSAQCSFKCKALKSLVDSNLVAVIHTEQSDGKHSKEWTHFIINKFLRHLCIVKMPLR